jgi:hypothetical protein
MSQQELSPGPPPADIDWAAQAADRVEEIVLTIRDKTTRPALLVARGLVFGLLALVLGIAAIVLVAVLWIRVLSYIPGGVWIAYLITGVLFVLAGVVLMVKRGRPAAGVA